MGTRRYLCIQYYRSFSGYPEENEKPAIALIQSFDKRQVIDNRRTIFHKPFQAGNTFCQSAEHGIVIDNKLTAILTGTELKFKKFPYAA
ncbi:hypothetical protein LNP17_03710 [Klebsiella variicola subsp. variicola]|nr:hypothetical protein [Klebsiella variicola subsp. variicola]